MGSQSTSQRVAGNADGLACRALLQGGSDVLSGLRSNSLVGIVET
jgi:hypothetical protein